jgi:precorrin-6A synthase
MGPQHVTPEVADALRGCDYVIAACKREDDPLLAVRQEICDAHGVELVAVPDPERDRDDPADYRSAVRDWHAARVTAYRSVVEERGGTAGFLVWGDPALYDSTIRVVEQLGRQLGVGYDVLPGISAPQALAAAHRIVLHEVGLPVLITTERRLRAEIAAGATNLVVMLTSGFDPMGIEDWQVWWGANLGDSSARLVAGRAGDVAATIRGMRAEARAEAGWVMDLYLLRRDS